MPGDRFYTLCILLPSWKWTILPFEFTARGAFALGGPLVGLHFPTPVVVFRCIASRIARESHQCLFHADPGSCKEAWSID